jgi:pimeloyl-ACP methyl ester carboxylesterase
LATFVLVHGGGHGGWCYKPVTERLRAAGHLVYAPSLTGLGERVHLLSASIDLETHVTDIASLIEVEELTDVILVGHSYGGMVITGVADRVGSRIGNLVYLDAANPTDGQSLVDVAGPMMLMARSMGEVRQGIELVLIPERTPPQFYGVTDPEQIAWVSAKLSPHPWACFEQPLVLRDPVALAKVPQSHIVCTSTLPGRDVPALKAASEGRFWDIDTGHDLMLTEPDKVTECLLEIAAWVENRKGK